MRVCKSAVRELVKVKGIEKMVEECPMDYGYEGVEDLCGYNQDKESDCIQCWKEVFEIDIENPKVKADMDLINFRPEITD